MTRVPTRQTIFKMKRPALIIFFLLTPAFVAAGRADLPPVFLLGALAAVLLFLLLSWTGVGGRGSRFLLSILPPLLFLAHGESFQGPIVTMEPERICRYEGKLVGPAGRRARRFEVTSGPLAGRRMTLLPPFDVDLPADRVQIEGEGRIEPFPSSRNPGEREPYLAEKRRGSGALLVARTADPVGSSAIDSIRRKIAERGEKIGGREEGLFRALFLADRSLLDEELSRSFRETGLAHLIALSGLHLGIFYLIFSIPLSLLPVPNRVVPSLTVLALWGFGAVASYPVSLVRALVMASLLAAGRLIERPVDRWNALGAAALTAILIDGAAPWEVSFQLSFAATAGILVALPAAAALTKRRFGRFLGAPLLISFAAQAATLPIILTVFRTIAPFGAPATLLATPLTALSLAAGSGWIFLGPIHPSLDEILAAGTAAALSLLAGTVDCFHDAVPPPPAIPADRARCIALLLLLLPLPLLRRIGRPLRLSALLLLPLPFLFLRSEPYPLRVTVLDVGQGSAAVAELPGGETILFDAGPRTDWRDAGERVLLPFLRDRGLAPVDFAFISHPDADHLGGALSLLEAGSIRNLVDCGLETPGSLYESYDSLAAFPGVFRSSARQGTIYRFRDGVTVHVLYAPEGRLPTGNRNEASLVLLLRFRRFSLLVTGDVTPKIERFLERRPETGGITALIVPHHGAGDGCTTSFLRRTRPKIALISAGDGNHYGHPDPAVLKRLGWSGSVVGRTDRHGAITIGTDGRTARIFGKIAGSPDLLITLPPRPSRRSGADPFP